MHTNFWTGNMKVDLCRREYDIKFVIKIIVYAHVDLNHLVLDGDQ
jgi:hypothetical protein